MSGKEEHFYRLRINIDGFKLEDIKVELEPNEINVKKVRVKITAKRSDTSDERNESREYVKHFEILPKDNEVAVDSKTMKYYLDNEDAHFLVVQFRASEASNQSEDVYVSLQDSVENLLEMAAKSLLNVKNIDDLKYAIQNPFTNLVNENCGANCETASIIRDLNSATLSTFTPLEVIEGGKRVRVILNVPYLIQSVSMALEKSNAKKQPKPADNHLLIRRDGLKLNLEANTMKENVTSSFSKQLSLPKGTDASKMNFVFDAKRHALTIEAPYQFVK